MAWAGFLRVAVGLGTLVIPFYRNLHLRVNLHDKKYILHRT